MRAQETVEEGAGGRQGVGLIYFLETVSSPVVTMILVQGQKQNIYTYNTGTTHRTHTILAQKQAYIKTCIYETVKKLTRHQNTVQLFTKLLP